MAGRAERVAEWDDEDDGDDGDGENWLASFSDLMADLLALFVILFSFAMVNQAHVVAQNNSDIQIPIVDNAYSSGNGILYDSAGSEGRRAISSTSSSGDRRSFVERSNQSRRAVEVGSADKLVESINNNSILVNEIELDRKDPYTLVISFNEKILFASGQASILPEAIPVLEQFTFVMKDFEQELAMIKIEGHTDNQPIQTIQFPSNWELSAIRASTVLRWMIANMEMISPEKFSTVGYGEFHPIADNTTEEGRQKNRRVDFVVELLP